MRILERCSTAWPMPEIQAQIDSLRLAFSADMHHPFELKPSFPYGSPSGSYQSSPPVDAHYHPHLNQVQSRVGFHALPVTPPISTGAEDSKSDASSQLQSLGMVAHQPPTTHPMDAPLVDENNWDPTRIITYVHGFRVNPLVVTNLSSQAMGHGLLREPRNCQHKLSTDTSKQHGAGCAECYKPSISRSVRNTSQGFLRRLKPIPLSSTVPGAPGCVFRTRLAAECC